MIDLVYDHASEALGNEALAIAYHERIRAALGAKPGESTLATVGRIDAALRAAGIAPEHGSLAERVARLAADRDEAAAEVARLRALAEPTRGDLINRAVSLGAEVVKLREQAERMPSSTIVETIARQEAVRRADMKRREAEEAWRKVREAMEVRP